MISIFRNDKKKKKLNMNEQRVVLVVVIIRRRGKERAQDKCVKYTTKSLCRREHFNDEYILQQLSTIQNQYCMEFQHQFHNTIMKRDCRRFIIWIYIDAFEIITFVCIQFVVAWVIFWLLLLLLLLFCWSSSAAVIKYAEWINSTSTMLNWIDSRIDIVVPI